MIWIGVGVLGALLLAAVGAWLLGRSIEREHTAVVARIHPATPEEIWKRLLDVDAFPGWRRGLKSVEVGERRDGRAVAWVEHTGFGPIPLRIHEEDPPRRLRAGIDGDAGGFGGTWTYQLRAVPGGTELTITEDGWVETPLMRVFSKHVYGYSATLERYQEDLSASLAGGRGR